jgi:hypothetical protein
MEINAFGVGVERPRGRRAAGVRMGDLKRYLFAAGSGPAVSTGGGDSI